MLISLIIVQLSIKKKMNDIKGGMKFDFIPLFY